MLITIDVNFAVYLTEHYHDSELRLRAENNMHPEMRDMFNNVLVMRQHYGICHQVNGSRRMTYCYLTHRYTDCYVMQSQRRN